MKTNSKEFKKLQNTWYKKLEKDGFDDLERRGVPDEWIRHGGRIRVTDANFSYEKMESQTDYYRIVGFFLHDHTFENEFQKQIWTYHAEGISIRDMVNLFEKNGIDTYRDKINRELIELKKLMLKRYGVVKNGQ